MQIDSAIKGVRLDRPVEFSPYSNRTGCFSTPFNGEAFILDAKMVRPFVQELYSLNQLGLIEETLQSLCERNGTDLKTAFPSISSFNVVAEQMGSLPDELKSLLSKWHSDGADEVVIDFESDKQPMLSSPK